MTDTPQRPFLVRLLLGLAQLVVGFGVFVYSLLDELLFPIFRPLITWLGKLALFERLERMIGRSPPYVVLLMLATPFALIEPAKLFAVYLIATGKVLTGAGLMLVAQVLSLLICERIFHAGREPLMRIGWFRVLIGWLVGLRDAAFGWVKATAIWRAASAQVRRIREWFRSLFRGTQPPH